MSTHTYTCTYIQMHKYREGSMYAFCVVLDEPPTSTLHKKSGNKQESATIFLALLLNKCVHLDTHTIRIQCRQVLIRKHQILYKLFINLSIGF